MATRERGRQRGQVLVLFTLALVAMIAMVGLVIDGGAAYAQRRAQQNAADLGALAAANALYFNPGDQAGATTIARQVAEDNGYEHGVNGITVTVTFPASRVKVDVQGPHQNYFAGVVGQSSWQVSTTAEAVAGIADTASGAAPMIMPISDFNADGTPRAEYTEANCAPGGCVWSNCQPCEAPTLESEWTWTVYGPNVNTSDLGNYLESFGSCGGSAVPDVTVSAGEHPDWGQHNNGNHNGAINQGGHCIIGLDVPVPIVGPPVAPETTCTGSSDTDGCFMGWAMFHVTGLEKAGNAPRFSGWFLPTGVEYPNLTITNCTGAACPDLGPAALFLVE